jgi:formate hydrogenlyase subunit 3/multisubunit Na+/H+ antiporter MnhD subunit
MLAAADWLAPAVPWSALAVVLPLAAALLATLSARIGAALAWPMGAAGIALAAAAALQVTRHGPMQVDVGGWAPPLGIALRLDGLGSAFLLAAALVAAAALAYARPAYLPRRGEAATRQAHAFWPLAYALLAALHASFLGADLFNLYVALELLTVTAVALVALDGKPQALAAALRYLMFALFGSLAYLAGVALLYAEQGTLDVRLLTAAAGGPHTQALAAGLMTVGLMAKAALFPLHGWLPAAHASAPAPASALLSALVVKAPFVILLRVWFEALPGAATPAFVQILGALGAGAILFGSLLALRQQRLKLVIAYSTLAQLGYLLFALPLATGPAAGAEWAGAAWTGAVLHALAHALAKGAMFLAAGSMAVAMGHDRIDGMAGLGKVLPLACFAFGVAAVSLMGLPPSGGFLGKYLLLTSTIGSGQWWWTLAIVAGGLLAAAYLFRPIGRMFAQPAPDARWVPVPRTGQWLALALALASALLGLLSAGPFQLLQIGRPVRAELAG